MNLHFWQTQCFNPLKSRLGHVHSSHIRGGWWAALLACPQGRSTVACYQLRLWPHWTWRTWTLKSAKITSKHVKTCQNMSNIVEIFISTGWPCSGPSGPSLDPRPWCDWPTWDALVLIGSWPAFESVLWVLWVLHILRLSAEGNRKSSLGILSSCYAGLPVALPFVNLRGYHRKKMLPTVNRRLFGYIILSIKSGNLPISTMECPATVHPEASAQCPQATPWKLGRWSFSRCQSSNGGFHKLGYPKMDDS